MICQRRFFTTLRGRPRQSKHLLKKNGRGGPALHDCCVAAKDVRCEGATVWPQHSFSCGNHCAHLDDTAEGRRRPGRIGSALFGASSYGPCRRERSGRTGYNKKHAGFSQMKNPRVSAGAGSGTRTHTVSPPTDFESVTSTNSITPANGYWFIIQEAEAKFKSFFSRPDTVPLRPQDDPPGPAAVGVVLVHPAAVLAGGDQAAAAGIPVQDGPGVRVVLL